MGAATAMAFALEQPERVRALVQITPAYDGAPRRTAALEHWDALADALDAGDIDAFVELPASTRCPSASATAPGWPSASALERHRHLDAVAEALRAGPALGGVRRPGAARRGSTSRCSWSAAATTPDPGHPLAVAEEYARRLPRARAGGRGGGQVAAGVAGGAAVEGDRRVPGLRLLVERRSRAGRSSRPPRRPPRSPGWCPSTAAARPCSAASSARRAKWRRLSSGSSANGGIVISPPTGTGQRSMKSARSAGAIPALPSSPATFTCTSTSAAGLASSLRSAESEATRVDQPHPRAPRP